MTNSLSSLSDQFNQGAALHLFQDSIDPIILTMPSGHILQVNQSTFDLLGYEPNELKGRPITELFDSEQELPDFSPSPSGARHTFDAVMTTKQSPKPLNVMVQTTHYSFDGNDLVLWILHDRSRQVELEQLREDLSAMLVHDLQGPLGNIMSSLDLAANELTESSSDTLHFMLDVAIRSSEHLKYLIDSLMDISYLAAGYPINSHTSVDAGDLIDYVIAVEAPNIDQRGIIVRWAIESGLPEILADESMLRRVLLNLLDNALKHSRNGQEVAIHAQQDSDPGTIRFSVIDQGAGVPAPYRNLIFEKFERVTTNSTPGGLGLGLAFCRLAVEAHGGQIWVEDAPSGGACFCFTMPAVKSEQSESTQNLAS